MTSLEGVVRMSGVEWGWVVGLKTSQVYKMFRITVLLTDFHRFLIDFIVYIIVCWPLLLFYQNP